MRITPENKHLTSEQREQRVDALLASPLAQQLERSFAGSIEPVRQRARAELAALDVGRSKNLSAEARELVDRRTAAKQAYEAANRAAQAAIDKADTAHERTCLLRSQLKQIANGAESWLRSSGFATVAQLEKRLGLKPKED